MRLILAAALVAVVLAACGSDGGGSTSVTELTVAGAWARPTPSGASNGVVYFRIVSPADDALVGVSVPADIAADAAMHETMGGSGDSPMPNMPDMATAGGEMTMTPLESVELPAGAVVVFESGGKHVMLTGVTTPLAEGQHFAMTVTTRSGASVQVDVVVSANAPKG